MCIIIDVNVFPSVFNTKNSLYSKFIPVKDWIINGKGKITVGGNLLTVEIAKKMPAALSVLKELSKFDKVHFICNEKVSRFSEIISTRITDKDFDDPHILALISISQVKLICTNDERLFKYLHKNDLYDCEEAPKIITSIRHNPQYDLLNDKNICNNGEHKKLSKENMYKLTELLCDKR